ncbi:MAG: IS30 family transposase, partial [Gammaproteobacteria bacterium]
LSEIRHSEAHKAIKVTEKVKGWMEILIRQELRPQKVVGYLTRNKGLSLHHETVYQLVYTVKANGGRFIYAPSGCLQDL